MYTIKQESEVNEMRADDEIEERCNDRKHPSGLDVPKPRGTEEVNIHNDDSNYNIPGLPPLDTTTYVNATFHMWNMESPDSAGSANFDQAMSAIGANDHHPGSTPPEVLASRSAVSSQDSGLFFSSGNSIVPCGHMYGSSDTPRGGEYNIQSDQVTPSGSSMTALLKSDTESSSTGAKKTAAATGNRFNVGQSDHAPMAEADSLKPSGPDYISNSTMTKTAAGTSNSSYQASRITSRSRHNNVKAKMPAQSPGRDSFDKKLELLKQYKQQHGHCDVAQSDYPLGTWVNKQRMEKKKFDKNEKSSMTSHRKRQLEELGFKWAQQKGQAAWDLRFKELVEYKAKTGNCIVPTKYKQNPALGRWVTTQRDQKKKGVIPKLNEKKLDSIGFVWDRYDNKKYKGKK